MNIDYADSHQKPIANALVNLGSGVAAGMAATCTTQPFDMLKTRMQLKPVIYKNLLQSAKKVYLVSNRERVNENDVAHKHIGGRHHGIL